MSLFRASVEERGAHGRLGNVLKLPAARIKTGRRLPVLLQSHHGDCAMICVAMIAAYFGHHVPRDWEGSGHYAAERGTTVNALMQAAARLKLQGRALRLEPEELGRLQLPAILHWDMDHFVVLRQLYRGGIEIHDPAAGRRRYRHAEVDRHFTGIAIELQPTAEFITAPPPPVLRMNQLLAGGTGFRRGVLALFVLSLLIQLATLATPFYVQLAVDDALLGNAAQLLLPVTLAFLALVSLKAGLVHWRGVVFMGTFHRLGVQMGGNVFRHLLRLPEHYFAGRSSGDIQSRFTSLDNIRRLLTGDSVLAVVDGVFSTITLMLLFHFSPALALLTLGFVAVSAFVRLLAVNGEQRRKQEMLQQDAAQRGEFLQNLRIIRTVKLFGLEQTRVQAWLNAYTDYVNSAIGYDGYRNRVQTLQNLLLGLDYVLTIYLGAGMIAAGSMSAGQLLGFVYLKQQFAAAISAMVPRLVELRLMRVDLDRLADIVSRPAAPVETGLPILMQGGPGCVQASGLGFHYPGAIRPAVSNVGFELAPGQVLLVTGPSGCGKSTLAKLLCGGLQADHGTLQLAGMPRPQCAGDPQGRNPIAAVLQEDILLPGSLHYNVNLGRDAGNRERLLRSCESAGILDDILQLPMQFATRVAEAGSVLSTGQVMRILLARALYREPSILILDETLSNFELTRARRIVLALRARGITQIIITHNRQLMALADKSLVMSQLGAGQAAPALHAAG